MTDTDIAWLAGIWDGEGYIGLQRGGSKTKNVIWTPRAQLEMTHTATVDRAEALIRELGCSYGRTEMTERNKRWQDTSRLYVATYWSVSRLGHALLPYAITKQNQWQQIVAYIDGRVERLGGYTERGNVRTRGRYVDRLCTPEELVLIERIRSMNRPPERSDEPQRRGSTASFGHRMGRSRDTSGERLES